MKKAISVTLVFLLLLCCLTACSGESEPAAPKQKAAAILENGELPSDAEGLSRLREKLVEKLAETDAFAAEKGLSEDEYYRLLRDDLVNVYLENACDAGIAGLDDLAGDELSAAAAGVASNMLAFWSQLDDLSERTEGYTGVCRALCEGDDMFNMEEDASDLTGDGAWPSGYFFDGHLPPLERVDCFFLCKDYLAGYGFDDAELCAIGIDGINAEQAAEYIEKLKAGGLYTYLEVDEEGLLAWYGCWLGDDGSRCFLSVQYSEDEDGDIMRELAGNRDFAIIAGNFDFELCANAAVLKLFL